MLVKRIIETYEDFLNALEAKRSEDAVDRNEGKNALGNFRRRNPELFDKYSKRYESTEEPVTTLLTNKDEIIQNEIEMNAQGRKEIAKYIASLEDIKDKLETMKEDEEEKFENMPEGLQESERGDAMQEAIEALDEACDNLEDVIDGLQGIV